MTFDHDFGYSLPLFSSLLKKEGRRKGEGIAKIMIKSHAFLLNPGEFLVLRDIFCFIFCNKSDDYLYLYMKYCV
jgi:hypothetical protein